ncbi:hypothetical protein CRUP_020256 [Coryphaenoides rupestris]|nr:hypothetical protein CRUP_020256 [Coryphaenoides rupestris]
MKWLWRSIEDPAGLDFMNARFKRGLIIVVEILSPFVSGDAPSSSSVWGRGGRRERQGDGTWAASVRGVSGRPHTTTNRSKKCMRFNPDATVWVAKQRILCTLSQSLKDVLNYGLFQPASNGRDGKFLDEERLIREYPQPISKGVPSLEFRYKSRVYRQPHVDEKQIAKLHTKANLRKFMELIQHHHVDKVSKMPLSNILDTLSTW